MKIKKQGFTLIEMVIVVGIIGILASMILVGMGGVRDRAKDTRITSNLNQLRVVAEMRYAADGNYNNVLTTDPEISRLSSDITNNGGELKIFRSTPSTKYCAYSKLNVGGGTDNFCVDSTGDAIKVTTADLKCAASVFVCR